MSRKGKPRTSTVGKATPARQEEEVTPSSLGSPSHFPELDHRTILASGIMQQTKEFRGPVPPPEVLREYAAIDPDSVKIILKNFDEQSSHRRRMEALVIEGKERRANRGQLLAGFLSTLVLSGSVWLASLGFTKTACFLAADCTFGLAALFITGRIQEKKERLSKEKIRQEILQNEPVSRIERSSRKS